VDDDAARRVASCGAAIAADHDDDERDDDERDDEGRRPWNMYTVRSSSLA
jgi:hypothetical protein